MTINKNVQKLSYEGCISILQDLNHVTMSSFNVCESEDEAHQLMREVIQLNLDSGALDEIEILLTLSGE